MAVLLVWPLLSAHVLSELELLLPLVEDVALAVPPLSPLAHEFDVHSSLSNTLDLYWFQTGAVLGSDAVTIRATSVYSYLFTKHLSASAAASVEGVNRQALADVWSASAKVGMRYTF